MKEPLVVHMSNVHPAFDTRILYKECTSLAEAGFDVVLIARGDQDDEKNGVRIRVLPNRSGGRFRRMTVSVVDLFRLSFREKAGLYHFHDPELIPLGLVLKALGKRVVFDVHENVAKDIRTKPWIPRLLRGPVASVYSAVQGLASRAFDRVVVATPGIAEAFPNVETLIVQNFPRQSEYGEGKGLPYGERGRNAAYVGAITELRGIVEMVKAMELLQANEEVRLKLGGVFTPPELENRLANMPGWDAVDALGWLDRTQVAEVLGQARMGMLTLLPAPNHLDSQPNKLFEYMAAGLPVIASDFSYWKQFVADLGTGLMVDPEDPRQTADAIQWLLDHPEEAEEMGRRGKEAVTNNFTWEREGEKLVGLYRELLRVNYSGLQDR